MKKKREFLPQTTSNLSIRHKYPLIATHGVRGGEPPVCITEVHPLAASLARSTGPVMTGRDNFFSGPHQNHPVVGNRRKPEAARTASDGSLAEDGAVPREQSSGSVPRSAARGASSRAWPARRNLMFRKPFSCPYKQFDHNSPIPGSEASFKCWSVEAHN